MLGKRLKTFAKEAYGSLQGLADATGIGRTQLSSYTTGSRSPSVEMLEKLFRAGCDLNWLVCGFGASMYSTEYNSQKAKPPISQLSEYELMQLRAVIKANAKDLEAPRSKKVAG